MEGYINSFFSVLDDIDLYLIAISGVLAALLPIIRKTKTKKDDEVADKALSIIDKIRNLLSKAKKSSNKK